MTPLHVAAERAHNDILEVLQKHGAKVWPAWGPSPVSASAPHALS